MVGQIGNLEIIANGLSRINFLADEIRFGLKSDVTNILPACVNCLPNSGYCATFTMRAH